MFLVSDREKADKEMDCYGYCLKLAIEYYLHGEFEKAIACHENIIRSLRELNNMVQWKQVYLQAQEMSEFLDKNFSRIFGGELK